MKRLAISMCEFFLSYSEALDFISPEIVKHHYDVAYLSAEILKKINASSEERQNVILAALVHDIGIFSLRERTTSIRFEFEHEDRHALVGALLLEKYAGLTELSWIVRHHHLRWQDAAGVSAHVGSFIIYLVDRIAVLVNKDQPILVQRRRIVETIRAERGRKFRPDLVDAFLELSVVESFWLNLATSAKERIVCESLNFEKVLLDSDDIMAFGKIFISAIDLRSRYTAAHSLTVAVVAEQIALLAGLEPEEASLLKLAGYFHDIGKVAVPSEITNKAGKLTLDESEIIKGHPFFTHSILKKVSGFERVMEIACSHHEGLNGQVYPFHLSAEELSSGARLLRIADVFTALTEDRPYRSALQERDILYILGEMAANGQITPDFNTIIAHRFNELENLSKQYQKEAYQEFHQLEQVLDEG